MKAATVPATGRTGQGEVPGPMAGPDGPVVRVPAVRLTAGGQTGKIILRTGE